MEKMQKIEADGCVFVWDEKSEYVEEIIITGMNKINMIDFNKEYDIYLVERESNEILQKI